MRNARTRLLALSAVMSVIACSTLQVSSDYDKSADFSKYSTFSFLRSTEIKSELIKDRIEGAITTQLTAKGLKLVQGNADLLVAYHARLDKQTQVDTTSYGYGWGGGWGGYYGPGAYGAYGGVGTSTTTAREIPVGTLFVDLVDASEKKMVWQGSASATLDPKATADDKDYRVNNAVKSMFSKFPPKK
jgi:Domain of unknown function (DUF4136)